MPNLNLQSHFRGMTDNLPFTTVAAALLLLACRVRHEQLVMLVIFPLVEDFGKPYVANWIADEVRSVLTPHEYGWLLNLMEGR